MSKPLDNSLIASLLQKPDRKFDRAGRIALIGELAQSLLKGEFPSRESALFVGGALSAWLQSGGSLEKQYLKISAKAGSHHTPSYIWKNLR